MKNNLNDQNQPLFPIGVIAEMVGVTPATLRIWEKKGLLKPQRRGKNRYYSQRELNRLKKIHYLLSKEKMNLAGVRSLLLQPPCWEIMQCGQKKNKCPVFKSSRNYQQEQDHDPIR